MSPWWVIPIVMFFPFYAFMGGLTRTLVHNHLPGHNKKRCDSWDNFPCIIWAGWLWPFTLFFFLACSGAFCLGQRAARIRIRHKADRALIARLEKENRIGQG